MPSGSPESFSTHLPPNCTLSSVSAVHLFVGVSPSKWSTKKLPEATFSTTTQLSIAPQEGVGPPNHLTCLFKDFGLIVLV